MTIRLAIVGFRHNHILDLLERAGEMEGIEVVATCEEDPATREALRSQGIVDVGYDSFEEMLDQVACDAVGIGDYYAKRGSLMIQALSRGKHAISDKPMCTRLEQVDQIARLSTERGLVATCMLNMRDAPPFIGVRNLIRGGTIGEVHAISFNGQHPLLLGKRSTWYFEPGKHGGTINDIGIHAIDTLPWITGLRFQRMNAARCWNAFAPNYPHFQGGAQMMLTMENGCGVLGDVSYFAPNSSGYSLPFYWRMTFWGRKGVIEVSYKVNEITVALDGEEGMRFEPFPEGNPGGYLKSFIHGIRGELGADELCGADALRAARTALTIQKAADEHAHGVPLAHKGI